MLMLITHQDFMGLSMVTLGITFLLAAAPAIRLAGLSDRPGLAHAVADPVAKTLVRSFGIVLLLLACVTRAHM